MRRILAIAVAVAGVLSSEAAAQIVQRPTRPYRGLFGGGLPPDPNRSRTELTLTGSLLAGYDTWLSPTGAELPSDPTGEPQSGNAFVGDVGLAYFRGRTRRSVSVDAFVRGNGYTGIDADSTLGGTAVFAATTNLGRVTQLSASQDIAYVPTLVLGALQPIALDPGSPVVQLADVTSGYLAERSWSSNSFVNVDRRWTARHLTQVGAAYSRQEYLDDLGNDSTNRGANAMHSWTFSRTSSVRTQYDFNDSDLEGIDGVTPMTNQNVELSFAYNRRLSPTRLLQIEMGGGATHVDTLRSQDRSPLTYWMPSGRGSVSWDVGRTWAIGASYSRSVDVLQGVSLTSFATDSASASANGLMGSRIEAAISASYANGTSGGTDTTGRFENYSGSLQFLYAFARCCATTVNYDYYVYHFQNVADLPTGFPPDFDRQAIRVGLTVWLPLYGTYAGGGSSRGMRRN
jgi:hypothetical protein